jgi:hypothetical protein
LDLELTVFHFWFSTFGRPNPSGFSEALSIFVPAASPLVLLGHHLSLTSTPLPRSTTLTTSFDPLKDGLAKTGFGVVASLVHTGLNFSTILYTW